MTVLPVVERELRAGARQPFTYTLRVLAVGCLLGVLILAGLSRGFSPESGGRLFAALHMALFAVIWILVPLLTADAISREKREGTMVLLALTPLSPLDVVIAKSFADGVRAFSLWLVVLPVLIIPVLIGGVAVADMVASVLFNLSSLTLALASGLFASSISRVFSRALVMAVLVAFGHLLLFLTGCAFVLAVAFSLTGANRGFYFNEMGMFLPGLRLATNGDGLWAAMTSRGGQAGFLWSLGFFCLLCWVYSFLLVGIASDIVRRSWRGEGGSRLGGWFDSRLCRPVLFTGLLRRWMQRELLRSPISWLEQRTWSGRLVIWSWLAVVISIYSYMLVNFSLFYRGFEAMQVFLSWLLIGSMAGSASGSFRRERDTGLLELLLVAPLRESQLIFGRLRALWIRFLPSIVLLCGVWVYVSTFLSASLATMFVFLVAFLTVPVIGLYFSLAVPSFLGAFLRSLGLAMLVPVFASRLGYGLIGPIWQLGAAAVCGGLLHRRLKARTFPFQR